MIQPVAHVLIAHKSAFVSVLGNELNKLSSWVGDGSCFKIANLCL